MFTPLLHGFPVFYCLDCNGSPRCHLSFSLVCPWRVPTPLSETPGSLHFTPPKGHPKVTHEDHGVLGCTILGWKFSKSIKESPSFTHRACVLRLPMAAAWDCREHQTVYTHTHLLQSWIYKLGTVRERSTTITNNNIGTMISMRCNETYVNGLSLSHSVPCLRSCTCPVSHDDLWWHSAWWGAEGRRKT